MFVCLAIYGCRAGEPFNTHVFKPANIVRHNNKTYLWRYGDLKGDDYEFLLYASKYTERSHHVLVQDQSGRAMSQLNFLHPIRSLEVLHDPRNNDPWLFVCINDQSQTQLTGYKYTWTRTLQREDRQFENIARTDSLIKYKDYEWYGQLYPILLEDIDGDGRVELVCGGLDAFTANPRGLIVYDFDSGKIKWRLDLSTQIYSLECDDFDGDGHKEFVCGTYAPKNSREVKEGIDDFNSWLLVVSAQGRVLYRERAIEGYGSVLVADSDVDGDGKKEIQAVLTNWGNLQIPNSVQTLQWNGKELVRSKSWTINGSFEQNNQNTINNVMDPHGTELVLLAAKDAPLVALDKNLNPVPHRFDDIVNIIWDVEDLDGDGFKEILLMTKDNRFVVLDHKLKKRAEIRNPFQGEESVHGMILRGGKAAKPRIIITSGLESRFYEYSRESLPVLLIRFFKAHAALISVALLGMLLFAIAVIAFHVRYFYQLSDSLEHGVILLVALRRRIYINNYLRVLLQNELGTLGKISSEQFRQMMPEVYKQYNSFRLSRGKAYASAASLGKEGRQFKALYSKMPGIIKRYVIVLLPEAAESTLASEKLQWAETARRLSHHVRRHITNILLAVKPAGGDDEGQGKNTELILSEIEKLRVFTHAFQRFTELKDYDLRPLDVIPYVEHCLEHIVIPANVSLIKNWQLKSVEALIEPIRFEEALKNLITNALDAMPEGGSLHLTVKEFPLHAGPGCNLSVMIEIEDSGKGIPAKYLEEIWQPFFTTKQDGTGIGLPETRKIVESMKGTIAIQSEEGTGTVVTIWLRGENDG